MALWEYPEEDLERKWKCLVTISLCKKESEIGKMQQNRLESGHFPLFYEVGCADGVTERVIDEPNSNSS